VKERSISVTEAARNFADCINRVRYQGISYLLLKNGTPVARLLPPNAAPDQPQAKSAVRPASEEAGAAQILPLPNAQEPEEKQASLEPSTSGEITRRRTLQW
jgi:prevent-host-death family protein